ncbi:hypothetical protein TIFTF001_003141 [Ficus carica]|uniref:Uncharacterized protein n=1 Tax=Ficus carica TaxID=3494 RepID=A0AA88CVC0_FICCA|nr:hypothetical protein TIFTF001_003141 [Ficus carica]
MPARSTTEGLAIIANDHEREGGQDSMMGTVEGEMLTVTRASGRPRGRQEARFDGGEVRGGVERLRLLGVAEVPTAGVGWRCGALGRRLWRI